MRVLVACETSGRVRRAFADRGHDAWSCDLLPCDDGSNKHIIGDARSLLNDGWDLLMVAIRRAPGSAIAVSGGSRPHRRARHLNRCGTTCVKVRPCFWRSGMRQSNASVSKTRSGHKHAKALIAELAARTDSAAVVVWGACLQGDFALSRRTGTVGSDQSVTAAITRTAEHKAWSFIHRTPPSSTRWKLRSETFPGIATAFAEQWG